MVRVQAVFIVLLEMSIPPSHFARAMVAASAIPDSTLSCKVEAKSPKTKATALMYFMMVRCRAGLAAAIRASTLRQVIGCMHQWPPVGDLERSVLSRWSSFDRGDFFSKLSKVARSCSLC